MVKYVALCEHLQCNDKTLSELSIIILILAYTYVPRYDRNRILVCDNEIIWIVGSSLEHWLTKVWILRWHLMSKTIVVCYHSQVVAFSVFLSFNTTYLPNHRMSTFLILLPLRLAIMVNPQPPSIAPLRRFLFVQRHLPTQTPHFFHASTFTPRNYDERANIIHPTI